MFAYPRRLALDIASLAALLLSLGLVALSATPAVATTCPSMTPLSGVTISDCSEIFSIVTQSGLPVATPLYNINLSNGSPYFASAGYDSSNNVLVGVQNTTSSVVYDLQLNSYVAGAPSFAFSTMLPGELLSNSSLSSLIGSCVGSGTNTGNEGVILKPNGGGSFTSTGQCVTFTNYGSLVKGDVVFNGGLPAGDVAIFALADTATAGCVTNLSGACVTPPPVSEPAAIGIFLTGLVGFGILRRRWLARAALPRRPRPKRQSRQIRPMGWISRLWATA